jgi:hypothetical protein
MSSTSSIDASLAGTELAGYRLELLIGHGSSGTVFEATQLNLDRRVALKLLPSDPRLADRLRRLPWPEHPGVVDLYATGTCEHGEYVATQLVPGSTLAALAQREELGPDGVLDALRQVAAALDAAHSEGIAHGAVHGDNVLVDGRGRVFLCDFGLGAARPSPTGDLVAFTALVRESLGVPVVRSGELRSAAAIVDAAAAELPRGVLREGAPPRRWWPRAAAAAVALGALAALLVASIGPAGESDDAPALPAGTRALGSSLGAQGVSSVDCLGRAPSGASDACTLVQTRLPGRRLVAPRDGVIRSWTVRGARGDLALQVLRPHGDRFSWVASTTYERVPDERVHVLPANLPLRAGDLVGVDVAPGAAVGVRRGRRGAATSRWIGPLPLQGVAARKVALGKGSGFDHEILMRVEYAPGARFGLEGELTGRAAERAPAGRRLVAREVEVRRGVSRTAALVRVGDRIALDLFDGNRRLVRLTLADARPGGRPETLRTYGQPLVELRWRNPDGRTIGHDYSIRASAVVPRS